MATPPGTVLVAVARLLGGSEMRAYCTLARLGGDEFVMMIPDADREQGRLQPLPRFVISKSPGWTADPGSDIPS